MVVYRASFSNGKSYIGCTKRSLYERQRSHWSKSYIESPKLPFHKAIKKYGKENIKWEIIFETDNHHILLRKEIELIAEYNTVIPNGYNVTKGGEGTIGFSWNKGIKKSEKEILLMREKGKIKGKSVVLVNCKEKWFKKYDTIAELCRQNNLPYSQLKLTLKRKSEYFQYKIFLNSEFNQNDKKLFHQKIQHNAIEFKIQKNLEIKELKSIMELSRFLNVSEKQARNVYYKNKEIDGWRKI